MSLFRLPRAISNLAEKLGVPIKSLATPGHPGDGLPRS
jgi:hypothetical protein